MEQVLGKKRITSGSSLPETTRKGGERARRWTIKRSGKYRARLEQVPGWRAARGRRSRRLFRRVSLLAPTAGPARSLRRGNFISRSAAADLFSPLASQPLEGKRNTLFARQVLPPAGWHSSAASQAERGSGREREKERKLLAATRGGGEPTTIEPGSTALLAFGCKLPTPTLPRRERLGWVGPASPRAGGW